MARNECLSHCTILLPVNFGSLADRLMPEVSILGVLTRSSISGSIDGSVGAMTAVTKPYAAIGILSGRLQGQDAHAAD